MKNSIQDKAKLVNSVFSEVYSKYDFVPGDKIIYFDDFSQDFIGDFPSKWNTNGTGEVVKFGQVRLPHYPRIKIKKILTKVLFLKDLIIN